MTLLFLSAVILKQQNKADKKLKTKAEKRTFSSEKYQSKLMKLVSRIVLIMDEITDVNKTQHHLDFIFTIPRNE